MFLIPWGNDAHLRGDSVAKRLMNTLAYGWVEHCNDIASCRIAPSLKISILCYDNSTMYFLMNEMTMLNVDGWMTKCI